MCVVCPACNTPIRFDVTMHPISVSGILGNPWLDHHKEFDKLTAGGPRCQYCEKPHVATVGAGLIGVEHLCTTAVQYTAPVLLKNTQITSASFQRVRDASAPSLVPLYEGHLSPRRTVDDLVCSFVSTSKVFSSAADVMKALAVDATSRKDDGNGGGDGGRGWLDTVAGASGTVGWRHCPGVDINGLVGLQHTSICMDPPSNRNNYGGTGNANILGVQSGNGIQRGGSGGTGGSSRGAGGVGGMRGGGSNAKMNDSGSAVDAVDAVDAASNGAEGPQQQQQQQSESWVQLVWGDMTHSAQEGELELLHTADFYDGVEWVM